MSSIDNRVVKMEFDNKQFESGVSTTMSTLDKLKAKLKFKDESKSLDDISNKAKKMDFSPLASAVQTVADRFSNLGIVGMTVLQNITTSVMNLGTQMLKSITIDPIKSGLSEYETQINSVQTILSNTRSKGTNIDQVNAALDELNTYADKTIYNFTEMTRNIGTFTAAGVGLDESVSAIKGIANLAAASGSTSTQASTAMYQLSQALAAGRVSLMDWNSVVNAGMGGELFQTALKRTAENMGTNVDAMIEKYGSFRESLTQGGWLTAEVLTETLSQIAGAYSKEDLLAKGYTESQANEIMSLAQDAEDAATKVTTFTKLIDTLGEALQSGWTQSWETIIGDFEDAKELWSGVSDILGGYINADAQARNEMLQGWADMGGRQQIIEGVSTAFQNLVRILGFVQRGFQKALPPMTSEGLFNITKGFNDLMKALTPTPEMLIDIGKIAHGVGSVLSIIGQVISTIARSIFNFLGSKGVGSVAETLLDTLANVAEFFIDIDNSMKSGSGLDKLASGLDTAFGGISDLLGKATGGVKTFGDALDVVFDIIGDVVGAIGGGFTDAIEWVSENLDFGDIFGAAAGGGIFLVGKKIAGVFDTIREAIEKFTGGGGGEDKGPGIKEKISDILDGVGDSIQAFTSGIKAGTLLTIAASIGILTLSLAKLSEIPAHKVNDSLMQIGIMMGELIGAFALLQVALKKLNNKGIIKAGATLILIATAVNILADAVSKMAEIDSDKVAQGLIAVGVGLAELVAALKFLDGVKINLRTSVAIIAIAEACKMLADAVDKFSDMSWDEIGRGLTAMGGALAEVSLALAGLSKAGGGGALLGSGGIFITVQAMKDVADVLKELGDMEWDQIGKGLSAMGGALAELAIATGAVGKVAGVGAIFGGGGLALAAQSLKPLAETLKSIGDMDWEQIGKGLTGMGGALTELGLITGILGKVTGAGGLLGAATLVIGVQALKPLGDALSQIGSLDWETIGRGLVGMGAGLGELALISGLVGSITGAGGLVGAATLVLGVQALQPLADALEQMGSMSWEEIAKGLVAMGGALTEVGVISGLVGTLGGPLATLGAGTLTLGVQGLGDLADALQKFGSMDWDSIGRGLTAMGAAMGETALGGLLNTFSGPGLATLSQAAEPLGTLADSVKKWSGVSVPEGLGTQLGTLADGIGKFTFGGFGAGAIATVAEPLGTLATSVRKWNGVTIPENIGTGMQNLADGVNAFTLSGLAGFSIGAVAEPLGTLATSVRKWNGIDIAENIGEGLKSLADGVGAFTFSGFSTGGMYSVVEPLGELATAVRKWNGITITEGLGDGLKGLADGLNAFASVNTSGLSGLTDLGPAVSGIASAANQLAGVNFSGVAANLKSFASSLSAIPAAISGLGASMASAASSAVSSFSSALTVGLMAASIGATATIAAMFVTMGASISSGFTATSAQFAQGASKWMQSLAQGISAKSGSVTTATRNVMTKAAQSVQGFSGRFRSAGIDAMNGLAAGIRAGGSGAINAAANVASRALAAAKRALDSHSPSKKFMELGEDSDKGLINGFLALSNKVEAAARGVATGALNGATDGLSNIGTLSAKVTPIFDGSNGKLFSGGSIRANVDTRGLNGSVVSLSELMSANEQNLIRQNSELRTSVETLQSEVSNLGDKIANMQFGFYVDGKNLAKATAKPMNQQLQILSKRSRL